MNLLKQSLVYLVVCDATAVNHSMLYLHIQTLSPGCLQPSIHHFLSCRTLLQERRGERRGHRESVGMRKKEGGGGGKAGKADMGKYWRGGGHSEARGGLPVSKKALCPPPARHRESGQVDAHERHRERLKC